MRTNKYNARKCVVGNEIYDSRKEMRRHQELLLMEKAGLIKDLQRQVKYILIPSQREVVIKKGKARQGKVIEREVAYYADFVYQENGQTVVEDCKGGNATKTDAYVIKRKLMRYVHGIEIREV